MRTDKKIESRVEEALNSLEGIKRASPSFSFYNKVVGALNKPKRTFVDKWNNLLLNPSIAFATILIILILNVLVIFKNINADKANTDSNNFVLTDEYYQSSNPSFYLENPKP